TRTPDAPSGRKGLWWARGPGVGAPMMPAAFAGAGSILDPRAQVSPPMLWWARGDITPRQAFCCFDQPESEWGQWWRSFLAASSGVISRCGMASISNPTMNFLTVAERSNGG